MILWLVEKKASLSPALVASLSANEGLSNLAFFPPLFVSLRTFPPLF